MRSEVVYEAGIKIENHFLLASTAMGAVRKLHLNSMRTEDTVNGVLVELAKRTRAHEKLPQIMPPALIDLPIAPDVWQ